MKERKNGEGVGRLHVGTGCFIAVISEALAGKSDLEEVRDRTMSLRGKRAL